MSIEETLAVEKKRRRLEIARRLIGGAAIVAILVVVLRGIVAFREEGDAWLAMKLPIYAAIILLWSFSRIAQAIVMLKSQSAR